MPLTLGVVYVRRLRARHADQGSEPVSERIRSRLDHGEIRRRLEQGVELSGVDLTGLRLDRINLRACSLTGLDLTRASLRNALLSGSDLSGSRLDHADLSGADLRGANLSGTSLLETTLWGANLSGADLSGSRQVVMAGLRKARFYETTRWPPAFDPLAAGAIRVKRR
jgi:uncharacterized protein YjbI with pentapeptide repeats